MWGSKLGGEEELMYSIGFREFIAIDSLSFIQIVHYKTLFTLFTILQYSVYEIYLAV